MTLEETILKNTACSILIVSKDLIEECAEYIGKYKDELKSISKRLSDIKHEMAGEGYKEFLEYQKLLGEKNE
jgi:NifU-like protein involved in Fe-S cluster formation